MKITIMGAGAIGGYFGARLADSGCEVGFVARGSHLQAMRDHGLTIESELGNVHLANPHVSDDPSAFGTPDVVLVCVKLWDTEQAAAAVARTISPETMIISLQNGVQKDDVLRPFIPAANIVGGLCYIGSKIRSPGVIEHTGRLVRLIIGEFDGKRSDRISALFEACSRAGINTEISADITRAIWEKFVFLVGMSAVTTSMRSAIGPIRRNQRTRQFHCDVMKEVVAVGRSRGVRFEDDFAERQLEFCDSLPVEMVASMYNDLQAGRRLEIEWLSGGVVNLAGDVPTPLNRAVRDILGLYTEGAKDV